MEKTSIHNLKRTNTNTHFIFVYNCQLSVLHFQLIGVFPQINIFYLCKHLAMRNLSTKNMELWAEKGVMHNIIIFYENECEGVM